MSKGLTIVAIAIVAVLVIAYLVYNLSVIANPFQMGLELVYADGSHHTYFPPSLPPYSFMDTNTGTAVTSANLVLQVTPTYTGQGGATVTSWSVNSSVSLMVTTTSGGQLGTPLSLTLSPSSGTQNLASGTPVNLQTNTFLVGNLWYLYSGWLAGQNYQVRWILNSWTLTLTFSDGGKSSMSATAGVLIWTCTYQSGAQLTSVSLSWSTGVS